MRPLQGRRHPARLPREDAQAPFRTTFVTLCGRPGAAPLTDHAELLISAMARLGAKRGVTARAWCVMPDHVHVVVETGADGATVEEWVRYVKRETQRVAQVQLWQRSYWDRDLRHDQDVVTAVGYVLANPVRKDLCAEWTDWPWSWSAWHDETAVLEGPHGVGAPSGPPNSAGSEPPEEAPDE